MTSHKPQALMILMLIIFGGMSFTYTYFGKNWSLLHSTSTSSLILLTFFIGSHAGDFIRYNKGMEAYNNTCKSDSILVKDIKTYVPNYNAFGVGFKDKMLVNKNSNFRFTEYFFNKSDMLLTEGSALLFGYGERFMLTSYALPIEIQNVGFKRYPNSAELDSFNITPSKIYLQIKDPSYKEIIKIELEYRTEIERWLTLAKTHNQPT